MFASSFRYIEILFDNGIYYLTGTKKIVRCTEDFVINAPGLCNIEVPLYWVAMDDHSGQHSVGIEPYICSVGYIERLWPGWLFRT